MSFEMMPLEIKQQFALNLNLKALVKLCSTSPENRSNICEDEIFVSQWIRKNKPEYLKLYSDFSDARKAFFPPEFQLKPLDAFRQVKEHVRLGELVNVNSYKYLGMQRCFRLAGRQADFNLYEFFYSTLGGNSADVLDFVTGLLEGSNIIRNPIIDRLAEADRFINNYVSRETQISALTGVPPEYIEYELLNEIHFIKYALKLIRLVDEELDEGYSMDLPLIPFSNEFSYRGGLFLISKLALYQGKISPNENPGINLNIFFNLLVNFPDKADKFLKGHPELIFNLSNHQYSSWFYSFQYSNFQYREELVSYSKGSYFPTTPINTPFNSIIGMPLMAIFHGDTISSKMFSNNGLLNEFATKVLFQDIQNGGGTTQFSSILILKDSPKVIDFNEILKNYLVYHLERMTKSLPQVPTYLIIRYLFENIEQTKSIIRQILTEVAINNLNVAQVTSYITNAGLIL